MLATTYPARQLAIAETWLGNHSRDAQLLLALGRICLRNKLWGKAKRYFETSIQIAPSPQAYYELARLMEALEEDNTALFQKGLKLVVGEIKLAPLPGKKIKDSNF